MVLINVEKYNTFENRGELEALEQNLDALSIRDVRVKEPDNPANQKLAKLITFNC